MHNAAAAAVDEPEHNDESSGFPSPLDRYHPLPRQPKDLVYAAVLAHLQHQHGIFGAVCVLLSTVVGTIEIYQ